MRTFLNQSTSGGISRVTNYQFKDLSHQLSNLNYKECTIWKIHQKNYHLNII